MGTLNVSLAILGSLSRSISKVSVVVIGVPLGVPKVMFVSCVAALLHFALFPKIEYDAAESMKAVDFFVLGGLVQPGGSSS